MGIGGGGAATAVLAEVVSGVGSGVVALSSAGDSTVLVGAVVVGTVLVGAVAGPPVDDGAAAGDTDGEIVVGVAGPAVAPARLPLEHAVSRNNDAAMHTRHRRGAAERRTVGAGSGE